MSVVTRKHVGRIIAGDLLVTLVAIAAVYAYLHLVVLPNAMAEFPKPDGFWQRAEVVVSFYLLLGWIALETGCFFLFLRSHFTRILSAVAFANCTFLLIAANREWLRGLLDRMASSPGGGSPEASLDILLFGPLILMAVIKGVCYAAALHRLPTRRVLLGALYANLVALAVWFGFALLIASTAG